MLPEMPMPGFWQFVALALAMLAWRIWGGRVRAAFRNFEERRKQAELQALYDRSNPNSHFRQSVDQINDDTPPVTAVANAFKWQDTLFETRADAEAARWNFVLSEARSFYKDLDKSFGNKITARRASGSINPDGDNAQR